MNLALVVQGVGRALRRRGRVANLWPSRPLQPERGLRLSWARYWRTAKLLFGDDADEKIASHDFAVAHELPRNIKGDRD